MGKVTQRDFIILDHACGWRRWMPRRHIYGDFFGHLCRPVKVTVFSGDLAVEIKAADGTHWCITSAFDGHIAGKCERCGTQFRIPTGPLYVALAEQHRYQIETVPGYGYMERLA